MEKKDEGKKDRMNIIVDPKILENSTPEERQAFEAQFQIEDFNNAPTVHSILNYNINDLIDELCQKIVGQDEAIRTLLTNIYYNQLLIETMCRDYHVDPSELDSRKVTMLLDGPTGTGKTAILKEISYKLDLPIVFCNANSFSETGYVGPSITDTLRDLYKMASKQTSKAERGIIVFDEVDKIASKSNADKDMKKGVQRELLGFISGGIYNFPLEDNDFRSPTITFDTSKITFILSGAFTNLRERKKTELNKINKTIGFASYNREPAITEYKVTPQDYIDEGLDKEFFGRIKVLTATKGYDYRDMLNILNKSTVSPILNFEKTAEMFGYDKVYFTPEFIDEYICEALAMDTGARALQTIMLGVQNRILLKMMNHELDPNETIMITPEILHEYNQTLIRKI